MYYKNLKFIVFSLVVNLNILTVWGQLFPFEAEDSSVFSTCWDNDNLFPYYNKPIGKNDTFILILQKEKKLQFSIPHKGKVISTFGPRRGRLHKGFDIGLSIGDSILSIYPGIVRYAKYNKGGYGKLVVIRHINGLESYYAHLNRIFVKPNDTVLSGQLIGEGGRTAIRRSPSHLHFETRFFDHPINPDSLFNWSSGKPLEDSIYLNSYNLRFPAYGSGGYGRDIHNKNGTSSTRYYKIRKGDTLYGIAIKNNTTVRRLCQINGLRKKSILRIGQTLILP